MIDLISVANMRQSDAMTIASGVSGLTLMARAAQGIYEASDKWSAGPVNIVTGSGNNGGDGFALAIILHDLGLPVKVLTLSDKVSPDADYYMTKALEKGVAIMPFARDALAGSAVIVDALLGTGFNGGAPRDAYKEAINCINKARSSGAYVISADINSGMNGDTGEFETAVVSDLTVTIGYLKRGLITPQAQSIIGSIVVADIGIGLAYKEEMVDEEELGVRVILLNAINQ